MKNQQTRQVVSLRKAENFIVQAFKAKLVPMIHGSPAIGKSSLIYSIAKMFKLKVIDMRLAQCDPTDLNGFPWIDPVTGKGTYIPMDTFPLEGDELPEGYAGWILFMDEITSAVPALQAAAYKIVLDRMVGNRKLHDKVLICGAGNLETDGAVVETMSTALQSRLIHLEVEVDPKEWYEWAQSAGFDYRITSFIQFKPSNVYTFKPDHSDLTYSSPRTLEFLNKLMAAGMTPDMENLPLMAGTISQGVAMEFISFCNIYKSLTSIPQIIADPFGSRVPDEPSVIYAMTGALAAHIDEKNAQQIMDYTKRLPDEFQIVMLRDAFRRNPAIMALPSLIDWVSEFELD